MTAQANAVAARQEAQIAELPRNDPGSVMEGVIAKGDLSKLEAGDRARYYVEVCRSVGLNPLTRPFLYVQFQEGGLQLYPRKEAADQLRGIHKIQTRITDQRVEQGVYVVVVEARHPDGRVETDIGAVPVEGLKGLFLANAMKKSITQGKRRATLAMLGLSLVDDDEIRAIKGARFFEVDPTTGEMEDAGSRIPAIAEAGAPAPVASGNAARAGAVNDLNGKVRDRFGDDDEIAKRFGGITAKQLRDDLVCWAYDVAAFKDATPEQVAEAALAIGGWTRGGAVKRYLLMEAAHDAKNLSMATDVATVAREERITDSFVVGAIDRALARYEAEAGSHMGEVDAAAESAAFGTDGP